MAVLPPWRALLLSTLCLPPVFAALPAHAQHQHHPAEGGPPPAALGHVTQPSGAVLPLTPERDVHIDARSGTWLSLDVSPDGRTILFDMLGDLYAMPLRGGQAKQITHGLGFDTQATYSPDGKHIAFISDRSGADNIWIARPDGSEARQISFNGDDTTLVSPAWSADAQTIFVSRYRADLNNVELWRYDLGGTPTIVVPIRTRREDDRGGWASTLGAAPSPDGKHLYYAKRIGGLNLDEQDAWKIVRRDLATGAEIPVIDTPGGRSADRFTYFRPVLSPDGRRLAYQTRGLDGNELRLRDLDSGEDRLLADDLDRDALSASLWQDIVPRYAFTPDGKALVIARKGVFERIAIASGERTVLPFRASMRVAVAPSTRLTLREDSGPVTARLIQEPTSSPDGERLAFSAMGGLYVQSVAPDQTPVKLPTGLDPVSQPAWSPDGTRIAYVTWSEGQGGHVWTIAADGGSAPVQVSTTAAYYTYPTYAPGSAEIVAMRSPLAARQRLIFEYGTVRDGELVSLPLDPRQRERVVARGTFGGRPQFTDTRGTVHLLGGQGLHTVDMASGATRPIATVKGPGYYFTEGSVPVDDIRISPDGQWLLVQVVEQLHLVPMPPQGQPIDLTDPATRQRRISDIGADYFEWTARGIGWSVGSRYSQVALSRALPGHGTDIPQPDRSITIKVTLPRPVPNASIVLRGARVLTMAGGDRVIEDADIVIDGERIAAIGQRGTVPIPSGAPIRDMAGKTILPGFIDEHDHIGEVRRPVLSTEDWGLRARLAYGVTTSFDPSTLGIDMLAYQDMLDAGLILGPRLRSTGPALFSMERIGSAGDAETVLHRYRDAYRLGNIKEYRTGNRLVRQWMAMAARKLGLLPTTEGALSLKLDLTQILDGFAGNEHALPATPLEDDVIGLLVAMRTSYSGTLSIANSGAGAVAWLGPLHDPRQDAKLRRFWSPFAIDARLTDHDWQPLSKFAFPAIAADIGRIADAGGLIGMGSHGELPGIGFHWEMEAHALGGMQPMAILHAATAGSAETIGRLDDLGTVEPGKLADLVILNADPSNDVRKAQDIAMVMRGGTLYDADTLAQLWPVSRPAPTPWFAASAKEKQPDQWLPVPKDANATAAEPRRKGRPPREH